MKRIGGKELGWWSAVICLTAAPCVDAEVDFNREIRPILAENCYACHGPDAEARKADVRLDTQEASRADLGGYAAIVPGKLEASELWFRIDTDDPDDVMPPPDHGEPLDSAERALIREWIESGAEYELHWSLAPPKKPEIPEFPDNDWSETPLDRFALGAMRERDLYPSEEASPAELLRRVSLDLVGLPPAIEDVDRYMKEPSFEAYVAYVDRLLGLEAYGEHWARMWLDLARYADTKGYEKDRHRDIWLYRDWVIQALNSDMPFDQFTIEQIAGDLLPDPETSQIIATAFHRNTMTNEEGGTDNEEFRVAAVKDRVDTTVQVWMGLTMGCAKCHSHKYDPIQIEDYYRFYALFNQTQDNDQEAPFLPTPSEEQLERQRELRAEISRLEAEPESEEALSAAKRRLQELERSILKTPVMLNLAADKRRATHIHERGNFLNPGEEVEPGLPPLFESPVGDFPKSRLDVARWLVAPENPLTARVMVNRVWARVFGVGLVETEEDFGTQGASPSHPEMLDWLAVEYRENGWSLKRLLREIVLSKTYRQTSAVSKEKLALDPRNRWLSRGPRFRLAAETVRDQALAASGLLASEVGGPSVMPPQPPGVWKTTYSGADWENAEGSDRYRRGIYTYRKRTSPHPAMTAFDAGSGEVCQIRRVRTNTPLQALVTLNDIAFIEAAGALSERMLNAGPGLDTQIQHGFRLLLTRRPTEAETERLAALYREMDKDYESDLEAGAELLKQARAPNGDPAMVAVANVLLNLDEAFMK